MNGVRALLSVLVYLLAIGLSLQLIFGEFASSSLLLVVGLFVLAYFLWPSGSHGKRHNESPWWDIVEILIELPVEIVLWLVRRIFGGLFKNTDIDLLP